MKPFFHRLNRLWRAAMTGFCFALFGIGGLLLSLIWFNLLLVLVRNKTRRRRIARRSISVSFRVFLSVVKSVGVLDYRIDGRDILRAERGCLVVANHPSLIDYVMLASVMPETDCMVKSALLKNPFVSGVIRAADYLINDQADALLPASRQRLQQGDTILIFPEGTRTVPGKKCSYSGGRLISRYAVAAIYALSSSAVPSICWVNKANGTTRRQLSRGLPSRLENDCQYISFMMPINKNRRWPQDS